MLNSPINTYSHVSFGYHPLLYNYCLFSIEFHTPLLLLGAYLFISTDQCLRSDCGTVIAIEMSRCDILISKSVS